MFWISVLLTITILILANALYVAAEFSTVSSRRSRLSQLAAEGNQQAARLLSIVEDPLKLDAYVASCQVGITLSSLILGFYAQGQVAATIAPLLSRLGPISIPLAHSISATGILLLFTVLQVLFGELVPKNIAFQNPERLALLTTIPMRWSIVVFKPLIWLFNGSGQLIMRLLSLHAVSEHAHIHSPEEITMLVEESGASGVLTQEEYRLLRNTLRMHDSVVRQVMIPRTQMLAAPDNLGCGELLSLLADSPYSRLPLYEGTIDNIVGIVHLRDLLCLGNLASCQEVREIMRPVQYVPETMPAREVLSLLQRQHHHLALILDEFGGTAGMVTIEDLIEEIFGEMQDEFDDDIPTMRIIEDNWIWMRGDSPIEVVNDLLDLHLPADEVDTIGGLVLDAIGHVPNMGDRVEVGNCNFRVMEMTDRWIRAVALLATDEQITLFKDRTS